MGQYGPIGALADVQAWVPPEVADDLVAKGLARLDRNSGVIYLGRNRLVAENTPLSEERA